jgi:hypothetical protein
VIKEKKMLKYREYKGIDKKVETADDYGTEGNLDKK